VEDILFLHTVATQEFGGLQGLRDAGALRAAVARPRAGFGGRELFATPFARAAALMDAIVQNHPFVDGNKRTGLLTAAFALEREGFELAANRAELVEVTVGMATHAVSLEKLTRWLQERSRPVGGA
jgi:death-on-curing protein